MTSKVTIVVSPFLARLPACPPRHVLKDNSPVWSSEHRHLPRQSVQPDSKLRVFGFHCEIDLRLIRTRVESAYRQCTWLRNFRFEEGGRG